MALVPQLPYKLPELQEAIYIKTNIGGFFFDAFLRIDHTRKLKITEHPIETGASIADHAFIEPLELVMEIGMSDTAASLIDGQFSEGPTRSTTAHAILVELQQNRIPMQVNTKFGVYQNMLIETIAAPEDYKTLYGLKATITLREVIVAKTKTVQISARPQVTNSTNLGNVEPVTVNESIAYSIAVKTVGEDKAREAQQEGGFAGLKALLGL